MQPHGVGLRVARFGPRIRDADWVSSVTMRCTALGAGAVPKHARSLSMLSTVSTPIFIGKHRCVRLSAVEPRGLPPLLLLGGTAQTVNSWIAHYDVLSRNRDVVALELRGQGPANPQLPPTNAGLSVQVDDLRSFLSSAGLVRVDVCGFSFGGRVALAFTAAHPEKVRRVVATSVAGARGSMGELIYEKWAALLREGACPSLRPFALASIMCSHHPAFLAKHRARIEAWTALVAHANTRTGVSREPQRAPAPATTPPEACKPFGAAQIEAIVTQNYHVDNFPFAAACRAAGVQGRIIVGKDDAIIDPPSAQALSAAAGWGAASEYEGCGHAVTLEADRKWRREVLEFLDAP